jgi:uncharacterized protein YbjT (DUF2867 family)
MTRSHIQPAPATATEKPAPRFVFVTGASGFMGQALVPELLRRGHRVRALLRARSSARPPPGCEIVRGDALEAKSFAQHVAPADTWVHLVGVSHPAPWKARAFADVDLASVRAALAAARGAGVRHFVYLSVAQPAPVMRAYVAVRASAEESIRGSGLAATMLRPWYVLGPGRHWPRSLLPCYWLLDRLPATRVAAGRLGLVTRDQMTCALVHAIESPPAGTRVLDVPAIRRCQPVSR